MADFSVPKGAFRSTKRQRDEKQNDQKDNNISYTAKSAAGGLMGHARVDHHLAREMPKEGWGVLDAH